MSSAYAEAVWDEVVLRLGPMSDIAREAHAALITRCAAQGMTPAHTAEAVSARLTAARGALAAGLAAFERLVRAVEFAGRVIHAPMAREEAMDHLLATKLGLAELYHHLAGVALEADAPGVKPPAETARLVAESLAELEAWQARTR